MSSALPKIQVVQPVEEISAPANASRTYVERRNWLLTSCFDLLLVLAVVSFICFFHLDQPSIHYRDETTHIRAIQEMRASGEWWRPTVRGYLYLNKPPLKMWLTYIPLAVFGESAFSYRFLDALAGVMLCTLLYFFGRRVFQSRLAGIVAALAMITSDLYVFGHGVRKAVQDSMLIFLVSVALMIGWLALESLWQEDEKRATRLALAAGILIGLATITKSVAGFLPLIIAGVFLLFAGKLRNLLIEHTRVILALLLPAVIIPSLWYVPHFLFSPGAMQIVVGQEIVDRASDGYHNAGKFTYYFRELILHRAAIGPELLLPALLWAAFAARKYRSLELGFLLTWALVPVALFTVIPSRLPWYISPALPGMALLAGGAVATAVAALKLPLLNWWNGFRNLPAAAGAQLIFLFAAFAGLGYNFVSVTDGLLHLKARHSMDLLVGDIVHYGQSSPAPLSIVDFHMPSFALHESTYGGMIQPLITSADSIDSALKLIDEKRPLVFTGLDGFASLATARRPEAYRFFPPLYDRGRWLVVMSYAPGFHTAQLIRAKKLIDFGISEFETNYGFGPRTTTGDVRVQEIKGPVASLPLRGDSALEHLGSTMSLNLMTPLEVPIHFRVLLNEQPVFERNFARSTLHTYEFKIPPGVWRDGVNALTFQIERKDGSPVEESTSLVSLNWLSMKLGDGPQNPLSDSASSVPKPLSEN